MSSELSSLRLEIRGLRALLESLELRVAALEGERDRSFVLVEEPPPATPSRRSGHSSPHTTPYPRVSEFADGSGPDCPGPPSSAFRLAIAKKVGGFLRRGIEGDFRGPSGREQLSLSSKYYLVCKDGAGKLYNPPLVTTFFGRVKELCFRGANPLPDTIFVGLPSQTEVRVCVCVEAASLSCPDLSAHVGRE